MAFEVKGAKLAMQRLWLTGQVLPVGARLHVQHEFESGDDRAVEVIYAFMLPRDAALRRFEVKGEGFEAHSELRRVEEAVRAYEEGIEAGHLAALAREYRDGVVNLTLGNLRKGERVSVTLEILAGVELHDNGVRFRFPFTLAPGYHPRARAADGELELPHDEFGDLILPKFMPSAEGLHEVGFDLSVGISGIAEIGSPSHAIRIREQGQSRRVMLAPAADVPDRDLILDVKRAAAETQILAGDGRFAMIVPSTRFGRSATGARKVALVIDRSGSMAGQAMTQARRAVEACLGALSPEDRFALIAFDDRVETFHDTLASSADRQAAGAFIQAIDARGGTQLADGFSAGARLVAGGGDVLVVTDGQVMGTEDILARARALHVRIHCLGIGSASQDRFLALLASATGGVSRFVTAQERVDVAAVDLFASIGRPVAVDICASGAKFETDPAKTVFAGTPWTVFGEGDGISVEWPGGSFTERVMEANPEIGETLRLIEGARRIAEAESWMASDADLAALSEKYGLASRATALIAVVKRTADEAGGLPVTQVVPVGMPRGTRHDSYFGAPAGTAVSAMAMMAPPAPMQSQPAVRPKMALFRRPEPAPPPPDDTDRLLEIAASLEPDGGVAGADPEDRALKTVSALFFFLSQGNTPTAGAFRAHVERMVRFLENAGVRGELLTRVVRFARAGNKPKARQIDSWKDVEAIIAP
jgi:Ca-activated chloride channel family protein